MVQYTNILIASAVAAAVPALSAPFAYLEAREIVDIDAREPMFKAATELLKTGASRRVITGPLQEKVKDAYNANPVHGGPGHFTTNHGDGGHSSGHGRDPNLDAGAASLKEPLHFAHGASSSGSGSRILDEVSRHHPRSMEYLDAREPMFKTAAELLKTGASRRVITGPLQEKVKDAYNANPVHGGPGHFTSNHDGGSHSSGHGRDPNLDAGAASLKEPLHFAHGSGSGSRILDEVSRHNHPGSMEYLDAREPMFKAATELLKTGASRRVITGPLQEKVKDAYNANPVHGGPGPFTTNHNNGGPIGHARNPNYEAGLAALREPIHFAHGASSSGSGSRILDEVARQHPRSIEYLDIRELEDLLERDLFYLD